MIIETKFNFNDTVYPISLRHEEKFIPCKSCNATGAIRLADDELVNCPKCYGNRGKTEWLPQKWTVRNDFFSKIGKIDLDLYNNKRYGNSEIKYMISATGIGSGKLWKEEDLFTSLEEAQAECDKRNQSL